MGGDSERPTPSAMGPSQGSCRTSGPVCPLVSSDCGETASRPRVKGTHPSSSDPTESSQAFSTGLPRTSDPSDLSKYFAQTQSHYSLSNTIRVHIVRLQHYSQSALASLTSKDLRSSTNLKDNLVTKEESLYCVAFGDPGHQKWIVVEAPLSIPVMLHVLNSVLAHRSPTFLAPATGAPMRI